MFVVYVIVQCKMRAKSVKRIQTIEIEALTQMQKTSIDIYRCYLSPNMDLYKVDQAAETSNSIGFSMIFRK